MGFLFYILLNLKIIIPKYLEYTKIFRVLKSKSNKRQKLSNEYETYLWHLILSHISLERIKRLTKDGPLEDLSVGTLPVYES